MSKVIWTNTWDFNEEEYQEIDLMLGYAK